ncbi:MAG: XdhC family protein [Halanaerobium sp.]|nr:XdhC family protein [Halanaerobium sp.]
MEKMPFYAKVREAFQSGNRAMVATITEVEEDNDAARQLLGEKILLLVGGQPAYSADGLAVVYDDLQALGILETMQGSNKPLLKKFAPSRQGIKEIFFAPLIDRPRLVIFGGGHIAKPLATLGDLLGFAVIVVDDREDLINEERFPAAEGLYCEDFTEFLTGFPIRSNDYLVIVTRGHQHDYFVLKEVINSPAAYIGMIGSRRKVRIIFDALRNDDGVPGELIEQVFSPIGLDIGAETPEEIAVAIFAEIIQVRRGRADG